LHKRLSKVLSVNKLLVTSLGKLISFLGYAKVLYDYFSQVCVDDVAGDNWDFYSKFLEENIVVGVNCT